MLGKLGVVYANLLSKKARCSVCGSVFSKTQYYTYNPRFKFIYKDSDFTKQKLLCHHCKVDNKKFKK